MDTVLREDLHADGRIILKPLFKIRTEAWTGLIWLASRTSSWLL
jgi:hypothetical protein